MKRAIMMNSRDNVATALENLDAGALTSVILPSQEVLKEVLTMQAIPFGHKLAITGIKKGNKVIKYGEIIGNASQNIAPGDNVHVHNVKSNRMQMPEIWYREEG
ncbi:MAG: UxaA family hydrolase [Deltaproteobacteria bacterium]|nr:UxaA family hydrolase [Deltaproteobacteria bacterium]